ncbi:MAG TPA: hypothetical protein VKX35_02085 [Fermentimonas sp.]|nr:hypothetical protein [Fermentimonas sp.]
MRKYIFTLFLLTVMLFNINGQNEVAFNTVPVVNGKVVFEQFILTDANLNADDAYAKLQKWVRDKFRGSQSVSGIRFDDKGHLITVSAKTSVNESTTMNYRLDISVTGAGCMIVVRDITYQTNSDNTSFFPKMLTAEQTITDQAVNSGNDKQFKDNVRSATLSFLNDVYAEINTLYQ